MIVPIDTIPPLWYNFGIERKINDSSFSHLRDRVDNLSKSALFP